MDVDKNEWTTIKRALGEWEQGGLLTHEKAAELRRSTNLKRPGNQVAQYFFFIALFCTLLAFGAIFIDEKFLEKIKAYFSLSDLVIAVISGAIAAGWFWYTKRIKGRISAGMYEIYMVLGALATLTSIVYICKEINNNGSYTAFLLLSTLVMAVLSVALRSAALWVVGILSLLGWFGAYTTAHGAHNLFLGLNYPVRFAALGAIVLGGSLLQKKVKPLYFTANISYIAGLAVFFISLWGVSIFGNYGSLDEWAKVRQLHVIAYSVVFGVAAALSFLAGIKYKEDTARDFGIVFVLLNLYTRYFEYFWDTMNKGIFFLVLAITFGLLGRWLTKRKQKGSIIKA